MISLILLIMIATVISLLIFGAAWFAATLLRSSDSSQLKDAEETELLQDMHRGMNRIEQRVEALEGILLERTSNQPDHDKEKF